AVAEGALLLVPGKQPPLVVVAAEPTPRSGLTSRRWLLLKPSPLVQEEWAGTRLAPTVLLAEHLALDRIALPVVGTVAKVQRAHQAVL
ncbi:MAG TPA: hypothetical protein VF202_10805, partial [Trueperaceae bacterium]